MAKAEAKSGYFSCGIPYNRLGHGPRPLVVFQGLTFENRPMTGLEGYMLSVYKFLGEDYTVYSVVRRPGLPAGCTIRDMAADYAAMIRAEFGGPVDVIGMSTGGSIVQQFAADHPDLVRRLVIHSAAHRLGPTAKEAQLRIGQLARRGEWLEAYAVLFRCMLPGNWFGRAAAWFGAWLMSLSAPQDGSDLAVTVEAEDAFAFRDRLAEIKAPTLVAAGDRDPFYTPELFRETAAGMPNARLALYPGVGHPANGKQFRQDVLAFLREGRA